MLRAIVIDDEESIRFLIQNRVAFSGLDIQFVGEAEDGEAGMEIFRNTKPDIVLTDIRMPGKSGLDCLSEIRALSPNTEVILISAYGEFEYARKALTEGAFGYLLKPIDDEELFSVLNRARRKIVKTRREDTRKERLEGELCKLKKGLVSAGLSEERPNPSTLKKAVRYVEENYNTAISLQEVADRVYLTPAYLSDQFRKETGKTFTEYLKHLRIDKARKLLQISELKVSEIADMVGYQDCSYFNRLFKQYTGKTPNEYRKQLLESEENGYE